MDCNRSVNSKCAGQSTVEFVVILSALLVIFIAGIAMLRVLQDGTVMQHVLATASHNVSGSVYGSMCDVFLF